MVEIVMNRNTIFGLVLVVVAGLIGWVFFSASKRDVPEAVPQGGVGQTVVIPVTEWGEYWTPVVPSAEVPVDDPLRDIDPTALGTPLDAAGTTEIVQDERFVITYYGSDSSIFITLYEKPLQRSRMQAEQELLRRFGLTKEQACRLKVVLNTMSSVDVRAAGVDYGLSFCPNGKPLPTE